MRLTYAREMVSTAMPYSVSDFDIQALVDNELDWESEKVVFEAISQDPKLQARYEQLKAQKKIVQIWWQNTGEH